MNAKLKRWLRTGVVLAVLVLACPVHAFYNPSTGRWLNRDPLGEPGFELIRQRHPLVLGDGPNQYLFIRNNPPAFFDPFGLCPEDPCDAKAPQADNLRWLPWVRGAVREGDYSVAELLGLGVSQDFVNKMADYYKKVGECNDNKGKDPRIKKLNDCRAAYLRGERTHPCGNITNYEK